MRHTIQLWIESRVRSRTILHAWYEQPRREKCKYWFLYLIQKAYYVRLRYYVIQQTTISTTANGKSHEDINRRKKTVLLIKQIKFRPVCNTLSFITCKRTEHRDYIIQHKSNINVIISLTACISPGAAVHRVLIGRKKKQRHRVRRVYMTAHPIIIFIS